MNHIKGGLLLGLTLLYPVLAHGQDEERIQKLYNDAIQLMGGDAYLGAKDMTSEGNVYFFNPEGSNKFNDYFKLPDKRRNEIGSKRTGRVIVVFNLEKNEGWVQDGQKETRVATPDEMKEFKNSVKHNLDYIFRVRFKDPQNKLFYLGPGEGSDVQYDLVKLLDEENDEITVFFDRVGKLPAKVEYRTFGRNEVPLRIVVEYSQWLVVQGVNTPLRTDTYRNGKRYTQRYTLKVTYNNNLQDSFFVKPESPK